MGSHVVRVVTRALLRALVSGIVLCGPAVRVAQAQLSIEWLTHRMRNIDRRVVGQKFDAALDSVCATTPVTQSTSGDEDIWQQSGQATVRIHEIAGLNPFTGVLWPGALIAGPSIASGNLTPVILPRAPLTLLLSPVGGAVGGEGGGRVTTTVRNPTAASVEQARSDLVSAGKPKIPTSTFAYSQHDFYSKEQAMLSLGLNAQWTTGGLTSALTTGNYLERNNVLVQFTQTYYTLAINPPGRPAAVFTGGVHAGDIPTGTEPIAYVQSVSYGRLGLLVMSSKKSLDSLHLAVTAVQNWIGGGATGELDVATKKILNESETRLLIFGGDNTGNATVLRGDQQNFVQQFRQWAATPLDTNSIRFGVPISYRLNYLSDNSAIALSSTTRFTRTLSARVPYVDHWRVIFHTGNDDKDKDTKLEYSVRYTPLGDYYLFNKVISNTDNAWTGTDEPPLTTDHTVLAANVGSSIFAMRISPNGSDTWRGTVELLADVHTPGGVETYHATAGFDVSDSHNMMQFTLPRYQLTTVAPKAIAQCEAKKEAGGT